MAAEQCPICGESVPFAATVHVLVNPHDGDAHDHYVCRDCYEEQIAELFAEGDEGEPEDGDGAA